MGETAINPRGQLLDPNREAPPRQKRILVGIEASNKMFRRPLIISCHFPVGLKDKEEQGRNMRLNPHGS